MKYYRQFSRQYIPTGPNEIIMRITFNNSSIDVPKKDFDKLGNLNTYTAVKINNKDVFIDYISEYYFLDAFDLDYLPEYFGYRNFQVTHIDPIPDSVKTIREHVFESSVATFTDNLVIPSTVESIGEGFCYIARSMGSNDIYPHIRISKNFIDAIPDNTISNILGNVFGNSTSQFVERPITVYGLTQDEFNELLLKLPNRIKNENATSPPYRELIYGGL